MNQPPPQPPTRLVVPNNSRRDLLIAIIGGLTLLALVIGAVIFLGGDQGKFSTNQLSGKIVAKQATGVQEEEIIVGGKGATSRISETGYNFKIHVAAEDRDYEVPVDKAMYDSKKVGDTQSFIRPKSEQK